MGSPDKDATLVTGATGFVGRQLVAKLATPVIVSRNRARAELLFGHQRIVEWDPMSGPIDVPADVSVHSVVNLMGESIADGRWTDEKKRRIRESRVVGTRNLVHGLINSGKTPKVFVSASATGIYGDRGEEVLGEASMAGDGFLAETCRDWELAAREIEPRVERFCLLRIGLVLGRTGGALERLLPLFGWGLGGRLGNGRHFMPWIHESDLIRMLKFLLESETARGVFNASAPNPATNSEFTRTLAKHLRRPAILPVPTFALRLALGEFSGALLESQRAVPDAARAAGFEFEFGSIDAAFSNLLDGEKAAP